MKWKRRQLQDLVFLQRGFDITQAQQTVGPYPVISSSGVTSYHNEFKAIGPGVVIGRKGTLGSVHFSDGNYWPHDTTLWSKDLKGNNPRFVYYYLGTIDFKRFDVGNSNPTLNRNHIHDLPALIPPPDVQDRIAEILSTYDDLIENNRRRMVLLEDAARQLYREWFVRLRFPGREHTRIIDGVPEGWAPKSLGDVADVNRESVGSGFDGEIEYVDIASVTPGQINETITLDFSSAPNRARRVVKHGDIIWSCVDPTAAHMRLSCSRCPTSLCRQGLPYSRRGLFQPHSSIKLRQPMHLSAISRITRAVPRIQPSWLVISSALRFLSLGDLSSNPSMTSQSPFSIRPTSCASRTRSFAPPATCCCRV